MDIRITKFRLNNHLSYDWWKYIAIIVASIFLWSLVFTMASPRLSAGEKMEIFVYTENNYRSDRGFEMADALKANLAKKYIESSKTPEILETYIYNYIAGQSETVTVFTTKVQAQEGDLFILGYGTQYNDLFAQHVDRGVLADFNSVISEAKTFYEGRHSSLEAFAMANPKIKEQNLKSEYERDTLRRQSAYDNAIKLEGYMANAEYSDLFRTYEKMSFESEYSDYSSGDIQIGEPLVWGLELTVFKYIYDDSIGLFYRPSSDAKMDYPNIAMGISSLQAHNFPLYFENLAVINYFIEKYHIGLEA